MYAIFDNPTTFKGIFITYNMADSKIINLKKKEIQRHPVPFHSASLLAALSDIADDVAQADILFNQPVGANTAAKVARYSPVCGIQPVQAFRRGPVFQLHHVLLCGFRPTWRMFRYIVQVLGIQVYHGGCGTGKLPQWRTFPLAY